MVVTETERLVVRRLTTHDALFVLSLVNDPDWLRYIGNKGVHTLDDARDYIAGGPMQSYAEHDFGQYLVELKNEAIPIGLCGLKKRDGLDHPDLGFAFLPAYRGLGYAHEACNGIMTQLQEKFGYIHLLAITSLDNFRSIRLLEKLGMRLDRLITLPGANHQVRLYQVVLESDIATPRDE